MRSRCDEAGKEGCKGVILVTTRDRPAYRFYLKEGFVVDKEVELDGVKVCPCDFPFKVLEL